MREKARRTGLLLLAACVAFSANVLAATLYVGPQSCAAAVALSNLVNSRGGRQISGNTIQRSAVGVFFDASAVAAGDVMFPNTFLNVKTTTTSTPIW